MKNPLVDKEYVLKKIPGKGGWTYAAIPEIPQDKKAPFGWVKVKGSIDDYQLKNYKLMPMGNGMLFLPVKAEIRKRIGKNEGDTVKVTLFADDTPLEIPDELVLCLKDEPKAYESFLKCPEGRKKEMIDWIYSAKKDKTKIDRIVMIIKDLISNELN